MLCLGPINFLLDPEHLQELRGGIEQLSNEIAVQELNNASWETVRNPGHTKKEYATALDNAEQAVKLAPEETHILNTLGVAQYRTGDYADSITTFAQNETLAQNQKMDPHPSDLIFKAMALYQLHREEEARATVTRLHDLLRQVKVPELERKELDGFLKELEELIPGSAFPKPVDHPSDDRALYPITTMAPTWLVEQSTPDGGICKPVRIDWLQMSRKLGLPKAA
jgi:tetratricopeptide (TPR) repeat protein